ncbi:MAG: glycosyltransferase family 39 protein [Candidatus Daviesbacteria bacterium]|nr:glycosyltransferase family 39 protein [Candidatus Daviesbacteria bacterium]
MKAKYWFILIIIIASIFRIFYLDLIEFKFDEAFNIFQLNQFYLSHQLSFHSGISSSGMHNFPLLHYLLIFLGLFSQDPQYVTFVIALINVFLVGFFYLFVKKFYGNIVAVTSSLLLASSPWAILYSRKIWHPDLILLFLIPALYFLHKLTIPNNIKRTSLLLFLFLALLLQQHFSGFYLLILTPAILIICKIRFNLKYAFIGFLLGLIPSLSYISYNLSAMPICPDCQAFFSFQGEIRQFDLNNFIRPSQILTGLYFEDALGNNMAEFLQQNPLINILNWIFFLEFILPIFGAFYIFKYQKKYLFILIYLLIPLIYFLTKNPARMYYFIVIMPVMLILFGSGFQLFFKASKNSIIKILIIFLLGFIIGSNLIFEFYFYQFLNYKKVINGNFGQIYPVTRNYVEDQIRDYLMLPYYSELRSYAFIFASPEIIHYRLADFFIQKQQIEFAKKEMLLQESIKNKK